MGIARPEQGTGRKPEHAAYDRNPLVPAHARRIQRRGDGHQHTHADTIEFRTPGPWWSQTANKLTPAVTYMHTMWRFFQRHPLYQLKRSDSMATSITAYRNAINGLTIKKEAEACA